MNTSKFREKYESLQREAKAIADGLKPLAKRYRALAKKASALGDKADMDGKLYRSGKESDMVPDGWNILTLFRLWDFKDDGADFLLWAMNALLNLVDEPFEKG